MKESIRRSLKFIKIIEFLYIIEQINIYEILDKIISNLTMLKSEQFSNTNKSIDYLYVLTWIKIYFDVTINCSFNMIKKLH